MGDELPLRISQICGILMMRISESLRFSDFTKERLEKFFRE